MDTFLKEVETLMEDSFNEPISQEFVHNGTQQEGIENPEGQERVVIIIQNSSGQNSQAILE